MKQYVRKKNDQAFFTALKLIPEFRENFSQKQIQPKLIRRFWKVLGAYKQGQTVKLSPSFLAIIANQTLFLIEKCLILVFNHDVLYSIM